MSGRDGEGMLAVESEAVLVAVVDEDAEDGSWLARRVVLSARRGKELETVLFEDGAPEAAQRGAMVRVFACPVSQRRARWRRAWVEGTSRGIAGV